MLTLSPPLKISAFRELVLLTKPRVTALVLLTTACGLYLGPNQLTLLQELGTLLATALVVASANTLNCWLESDVDALMARTQSRPLPAGRLDPRLALGFGLLLGAVSVPLLEITSNRLTSLLGLFALVVYVAIYTPMKRLSPKALVVGAVPGAMPPLMGYTAATGQIDRVGLAIFGILFLWQLPHFIAIATFRKNDYANAGLKVVPVVRSSQFSVIQAVGWALLLIPVSMAPWFFHTTSAVYGLVAAALSLTFAWVAAEGLWKPADAAWGRKLFRTSLPVLTVMLVVLMWDAR